jgi:hypothetical protein
LHPFYAKRGTFGQRLHKKRLKTDIKNNFYGALAQENQTAHLKERVIIQCIVDFKICFISKIHISKKNEQCFFKDLDFLTIVDVKSKADF